MRKKGKRKKAEIKIERDKVETQTGNELKRCQKQKRETEINEVIEKKKQKEKVKKEGNKNQLI